MILESSLLPCVELQLEKVSESDMTQDLKHLNIYNYHDQWQKRRLCPSCPKVLVCLRLSPTLVLLHPWNVQFYQDLLRSGTDDVDILRKSLPVPAMKKIQ